ncbi:MAG: phage tail tip lysozyme [Acutalibacteraceae bacterium]
MKKAFQTIFSVVIMLTAICAMSFPSGAASSNKDKVFDYLTQELGFSTAAACGVMANIEKESEFNAKEVIIDSNGLPSGGLCQWNGSRFTNLKKYCSNNNYDYLSVEGQLSYLEHELKSGYTHIYNYLKNVSNNASGAYDAAYYWCYYFEVPANRSSKAVNRGSIAKNNYWPSYSKKANQLSSFKLSCSANGKTADILSTLNLKWNSAGTSAKSYTVYITKSENGKTKTVKKEVLSSSARSYSIKLKTLGTGSYSAYVTAKNSTSSKNSSAVKFSVKCTQHIYTSKITKSPTETATGIRTYTCTKCGNTVTKSVSKTTSQAPQLSLKTLKVSSASGTKIAIKWSRSQNASGYEFYRYSDGKWKKATTVYSSITKFTFTGLSQGKTYKIKVRAFADAAGKTVYSPFVTITAATKTSTPVLSTISRPAKATVGLEWKKVSGADSYAVYVREGSGEYKKYAVYDAGTTKCTIKKLESGKTYYFKIRACNKASANSVWSNDSNIKYAVAK